jgi:hypothetical protein
MNAAGGVGIGTNALNHQLTVGQPETPIITSALVGVYRAGSAFSIVRDTTNNIEGLFGAGSGAVIYGSMTAHPIQFRTSNNNKMVIAAGGDVGIGINAPGARLHISGGDAAVTTQGNGIILRATDGANGYRVTVNNAGTLTTASVTCP